MLAVVEPHPVQYHAPVYRSLQQRFGVPVTAIYGSDRSIRGYRDDEFAADVAWDTDLLSGYSSRFLSTSTTLQADSAAIVAALRTLQPSAVLLCGYTGNLHFAAWMAAAQTGLPTLFRGETTDTAVDRSWLKSRIRQALLRRAYARCARFLYIGGESRAHYRRLDVPEERLVFAPYCVDLAAFNPGDEARAVMRPATRARLGIDPKTRVLIFSGKLSARKGVDLLVTAVRTLPAELRAEIVVLFVGDGAERASLAAAAGDSPRVETRFVGFQNQSALSAYYHAADLLVLPSRHGETWGLVVNEALHHGVPCVVSERVGCATDLVHAGRSGVRVATGSAAALAIGITAGLALAVRSDIRELCRQAVAPYSVEAAAAGIASAYRDATAGATAAAGAR
jgi:glycosyltransferase involved in cell wall biosynthesis